MSKFGQTKKILIKIIYVGKLPATKIFRAPSGQVYSDKGIDRILMEVADNLEKSFTGSNFRLVVIDPRKNLLKCPQFNFIESLKQTEETKNTLQKLQELIEKHPEAKSLQELEILSTTHIPDVKQHD